jgi:hypothetical protein
LPCAQAGLTQLAVRRAAARATPVPRT